MDSPQHRSTTSGLDIANQFSYLQWQDLYDTERPFQILIEIPSDAPEQRKTNLVFAPGPQEIVRNLRGRENEYTLDKHGFALMKHQVSLRDKDWYDSQKVENFYLPECEQLIRERMDGVDKVYFYDWRLRDTDVQKRDGDILDMNNPVSPLGPALQVHVDQSPSTVVERVFLTFPEAEQLLQGRVRLINLWRPLNGPLRNWPLALCDGSTMPRRNLVETDRIRRKYTGRTMFVMHEPGMEWHYVSEQSNDEVLVFKSFDSQEDVTGYSAHASFCMPDMASDSFPRHSIELRALIFTNA